MNYLERVSTLLKRTGKTCAELASSTGISEASLRLYASGEAKTIPSEDIKKLADGLGMTVEQIFGIGEATYHPNTRIASCGQRIAAALARKGMKQSDLCKITGIPKSSMSLYLSGAYEPKQDKIYAMAKALDVSTEWLMGYDLPPARLPWEEKALEEPKLTEGEKALLDLFNQVPEDKKQIVLEMIRVALKTK